MKTGFTTSIEGLAAPLLVLLSFLAPTHLASAALNSARVTQVIQDVKLLPSNATPRPAVVNDDVREGTAVRTGQDSRTELTFEDKTLTRLGSNSVFSFNTSTHTFDLGQGAVLMQVPPNGSTVKVKTAAVTAAISGGTALFGNGPPAKFMVLEGTGTFYPNGHPEEAITLHGGEMVTFTPDGHMIGPTTFDVKTVLETSELIVDFPDLANLPLILTVVGEQQGLAFAEPTPAPKDPNDTVDQANNASPGSSPVDTGKFGSPSTIGSPNPYVITNGTSINTDPTITTNGVTNQGKIYQGQGIDGPFSAYAFGSTSTFDTNSGFDGQVQSSGAVFKFQALQLTGNPTIDTTNGETSLALIGVDGITSGGPGGSVTFAGITGLLFATQNGSINIGSEISFAGPAGGDLNFYARGSGSNLTLGSAISGYNNLRLYSEGTVQLNGAISATNFNSYSGGDFLTPTASILADSVNIQSLANVNVDASLFPGPLTTGGTFSLNAANTLNIINIGGGTFGWTSFSAIGTTINLSVEDGHSTIDFSNSTSVTITGGSGGINGSEVSLKGADMHISTTNGGDISLYSVDVANSTLSGFVHAAGSFTAQQDVATDNLTAGTFIDIGGNVIAGDITAGTTIDIGGRLAAFGTVTAGGDITADTVAPHNIDAPNGVLTAGSGGIHPFVVIFGPGDGPDDQQTYNVKSIVSPHGIDFSGNQYDVNVNNPGPGGKLTINATTIDFNSATGIASANFNGADQGGIANEPSEVPAFGGSGGTFIVNATGNITTVLGSNITATTGFNFYNGEDIVYSGAGGAVTLHSSAGIVTVDSRIEVSSRSFGKGTSQFSASGGTILLQSDLATGTGITLGANARLFSLLDSGAPGPGGSITLSTMGADITIAAGSNIEADRGTITIDQDDPPAASPLISINGTLASEFLNVNGAGDVNIGETADLSEVVTWSIQALGNITTGDLDFYNNPVNSSGNVFISAGQALTTGNIDIDNGYPDVADALNYTFQAGTDLTVNGYVSVFTTTGTASGGNVSLTAGGNITVTDSVTIDLTPGGDLVTGANILLDAGGNLTSAGLSLSTSAYGKATIDDGGNIDVNAGGDLIVSDSGDIDLKVDTSFGGAISTGGNITLDIGGSLTTPTSAHFNVINNSANISTGGNISVMVGGDLTAPTGVELNVLNSGGSISTGGNVNLSVTGAVTAQSLQLYLDSSYGDVGTGGELTLFIGGALALDGSLGTEIDGFGGSIGTGGNINVHVVGDFTDTVGDFHSLNFFILNGTGFFDVPGGGDIGTGGNINLTFDGNVTTVGSANQGGFYAQIQNGGSSIGTGGNISITLNGTTSVGPLVALIENDNGGEIGTGGNITVGAGDVTTAGRAVFELTNNSGTIASGVAINVITGDLSVGANFYADIQNSSGELVAKTSALDGGGSIGGDALINVTTREMMVGGSLYSFIDNTGGTIDGAARITFDLGNLNVTGSANFNIYETPTTLATTSVFPPPGSTASIGVTANEIIVGGDLNAYIDNSLGGPTLDDGSAVKVESFGAITVTGRLNVLGTVLADDDVNVGTLSVTNLDTQGNNTIVGAGGITPFSAAGEDPPDILHTLTTRLLSSAGGINFNGIDADGDFSTATNGGALTINALTLSFGHAGNIMGSVTFNGGAGSGTFGPGSGGIFTVNTTSDITVDSDIEATSGYQDVNAAPSGAGGAVSLNSTNGKVTVNNRIEVSSNDPDPEQYPPPPVRRSNSGGNISITSGKANAEAINIGSTARLFSLLNFDATGSGGMIEISATGNGSTIDIDNSASSPFEADWAVQADGGTIDINNHGNNSFINISNASMHADVIKTEIFGTGGTLTVGGGLIDASTALTMYAASSNGSIIFNASVTLNSGATAAIIAANTVTINNGVTVTIGGSVAAQIYANVRNYDVASGGTGGSFGSFAGAGATSQPFDPDNPPVTAKAATVSTSSATAGSGALTAVSQPKSGQISVAQSSALKTGLIAKPLVSKVAVAPSSASRLIASKPVLNVANSTELLAQLESATESGGKIKMVAKAQTRNRVQSSTRRGNVVRTVTASTTSNPASTTTKSPMAVTTPVSTAGNSVGGPVTTRSY